jgi:hypothetical protein
MNHYYPKATDGTPDFRLRACRLCTGHSETRIGPGPGPGSGQARTKAGATVRCLAWDPACSVAGKRIILLLILSALNMCVVEPTLCLIESRRR